MTDSSKTDNDVMTGQPTTVTKGRSKCTNDI